MIDQTSRAVVLPYSFRTVGPYYPVTFGPLAVLAYLAQSWVWWVLLAAVLLVLAVTSVSRLVVDEEALTLESVLHLTPRQRFRWDELGPFGPSTVLYASSSPFGIIRARIHGDKEFRYLWILSSDYVSISAVYGPSSFARALRKDDLLSLVERYRVAASG